MLNFCTLFNTNYLSRGLAMYESLARHCRDFHLYIFPFDDKCRAILDAMKLPSVTVVPMAEFEDPELLRVKKERTPVEYCWTCTPSTVLHVIERYGATNCTYLDADIYFFGSPESIISLMGRTGRSVVITPHRYSPEHDRTETSGRYCVQFVTFKNDARGMKTLRWWRDACLEWCHEYYEDGKLGDQKYLDDWTTRFEGVLDLEYPGGGVAPWNVGQYDLFAQGERLMGREKRNGREFDVIFYHFQGLKFFEDRSLQITGIEYEIDRAVRRLVYRPYLSHLAAAREAVSRVDSVADPDGHLPPRHPGASGLAGTLKNIARRLRHGHNNVYSRAEFEGIMGCFEWHI